MLVQMSQRALWPLVLVLSAGGILVGHDLSYRLTGAGALGLHAYLEQMPQVLVALLVPAVLVALSRSRSAPRPGLFALLGAGGFTLMEHLERAVRGELPWLLTSTVFLLGLVLQLPFGLAAWWLGRLLAEASLPLKGCSRLLPRFSTSLNAPLRVLRACAGAAAPRPRAPPTLL